MRVRQLGLCVLVLTAAVAARADDAAQGDGAKPPTAGTTDAAKPGGAPARPVAPAAASTTAPTTSGSGTATAPAPATKPAGDSAARTPPRDVPEIQRAAPKSLDDALARLGRMRCDVDFREMPLEEATEFLAKVARMNTIVSPALRTQGLDGIPKLTLKLKDVTLRQLAELVAKFSGTKLAVRDGVLMFATPEEARGEPVLRIYSLADLTFKLRNFPGPDIQLHLASVEFEPEPESDVESPLDDPEAVMALLRKMTGDGTWDDEDVSMSGDARKLVVRQYPAVHKEIARLLAVLRSAK